MFEVARVQDELEEVEAACTAAAKLPTNRNVNNIANNNLTLNKVNSSPSDFSSYIGSSFLKIGLIIPNSSFIGQSQIDNEAYLASPDVRMRKAHNVVGTFVHTIGKIYTKKILKSTRILWINIELYFIIVI